MSNDSSMDARRPQDTLYQRRVSDWYGSSVGALESRLNNVGQGQYQPLPVGTEPRYIPVLPPSSSSMASSSQGPATQASSNVTPSLISSRSTMPSSISVRTSSATSVLGVYQDFSAEGNANAFENPATQRRATWQCPFPFLGCNELFNDIGQWYTHFQWHFRGHLPSHVECPLDRCNWFHIGPSATEAWGQQWTHVLSLHGDGGRAKPRATAALINHLWRKKVITTAQEQELRQPGPPVRTQAYVLSNSNGRARRERSRQPSGSF